MKEIVKLFKALSDESRLRILNLVFHVNELCVCDIQRVLGFTQTKVSRHLSYLKNAGILEDERNGGWILYRLNKINNPMREELYQHLKKMFATEQVLQDDIKVLNDSVNKGQCVSISVLPIHKVSE